MNINRKVFFDAVRATMHKGSMTSEQVASYSAILNAADGYPVGDPRHLAYIFATTRGEVGHEMQPVREIGRGKGRAYGAPDPVTHEVYYGRGFVQLTWADNYKKMGKRIGFPLYEEPDLAMRTEIAARIIVIGMMEGIFTGKKLSDYINAKGKDYREARRIINKMDRADEFASFAVIYEKAIMEAMRAATVIDGAKPDTPTSVPSTQTPATETKPSVILGPDEDAGKEPRPRSLMDIIIAVIAAAIGALFIWIFSGGHQ